MIEILIQLHIFPFENVIHALHQDVLVLCRPTSFVNIGTNFCEMFWYKTFLLHQGGEKFPAADGRLSRGKSAGFPRDISLD